MILTSVGGSEFIAPIAADLVEERSIKVVIERYCLSSCAEMILPAAAHVRLEPSSIVGFHQNPIMRSELIKRSRPDLWPLCNQMTADEMRQQLADRGINTEFWEVSFAALGGEYTVDAAEENACPQIDYLFDGKLFAPSSKQLREDFGLSFEGSVCVDDDACIQRMIDTGIRQQFVITDQG